jgi:hypothetical protein
MAMSEAAKAARAAYMREYRKRNRERLLKEGKERQERYWERQAEKIAAANMDAQEEEDTQEGGEDA